jgi:EpsI family protein
MNVRIAVATVFLAAVGLFVRTAADSSRIATAPPMPTAIAAWSGVDAPPLDPETERVLRADWYVNRLYQANGQVPVGVYVAYYGAEGPGVGLHSPLHCLPGTGWETVRTDTVDVASAATSATVRELVVRKDATNALVLYWYDIHGHVVAGEMASKMWLLRGALAERRSDAALVRIVVPVEGSLADAERIGTVFARNLLPVMRSLWS